MVGKNMDKIVVAKAVTTVIIAAASFSMASGL